MTARAILALTGAVGNSALLPRAPIDLVLSESDFVLIEVAETRQGASFADLCLGLAPLAAGSVRFLERDWRTVPAEHADALRGHVGRLFHVPLHADTEDVGARVLLSRLYHTRASQPALQAEAAVLATNFGLPGLPRGPATLMTEPDLLRAAAVRAFVGQPRLLILELPLQTQREDFLSCLLAACADARRRCAAVLWLAAPGRAMDDPAIRPATRLRLSDAGLGPLRRRRT